MLGEVNLTHTTSAEQALNNVAGEDLTVVQRHVRKPTNDKANAYKERGHQKAKDSEGMLAPITESMIPSALPDWSALSRSARRQAIKWMIGLGYNGSPRRSSQWNGSLNRSELEVQFLEAPEQKGAVPFEPTIACRTVLGL